MVTSLTMVGDVNMETNLVVAQRFTSMLCSIPTLLTSLNHARLTGAGIASMSVV
jgi:hypothetical protein